MKKGFRHIERRIAQACKEAGHKRVYVFFSAYPSDPEDDEPLDNLDEIAVNGKVAIIGFRDEYWGGIKSRTYVSPVLENPTWLEVAVHCNAMIRCTRDTHHHFLEGVENVSHHPDDLMGKIRKKAGRGVKLYEFQMGS